MRINAKKGIILGAIQYYYFINNPEKSFEWSRGVESRITVQLYIRWSTEGACPILHPHAANGACPKGHGFVPGGHASCWGEGHGWHSCFMHFSCDMMTS